MKAHYIAAAAACGAVVLGGVTLAAVQSQPTGQSPAPPVLAPAAESHDTGCGVERAAVKHLTDGFVLPNKVTVMTVDQLVNMAPPPVTRYSPRLAEETVKVELRNVHVVAVKQEPDSDLHVIIATATGAEMNVESPMARCDASSPYAPRLAVARAAMDAAMPNVSGSHYTPVDLHATIRGVLFFDVLHGQRGAPNGVELHPITMFKLARY